MPTVDCETSEEYFYDSEQSLLASEASEDSFNSANEELFLPYDVRADVRRISAYKLVNKLFKVVFLALLAGVQNMREIMLIM